MYHPPLDAREVRRLGRGGLLWRGAGEYRLADVNGMLLSCLAAYLMLASRRISFQILDITPTRREEAALD